MFVASAVVTLMHWWRVRDRRLLPLTGLFLMLAAAYALERWHPWRTGFLLAAAACGLAQLPMMQGQGHGHGAGHDTPAPRT